jgi:hypothetical protein
MGGCDYLFIMSQKKILRIKLALSVMNFWDYLYLQKGSWEFVIIFPLYHKRKSLRMKLALSVMNFWDYLYLQNGRWDFAN